MSTRNVLIDSGKAETVDESKQKMPGMEMQNFNPRTQETEQED